MPLTGFSQLTDRLDAVPTFSSTGSGHSSWTEDVREVIADLQELHGATEADFLAVGGDLMSFLSASRRLQADIGGLTALVSGEQAQHACNTLVSVRRFVQETQLRSQEGGRALLILQAGADRIRRRFSAFGKIALSFRITALAAKIEVAHIATSEQNLRDLAQDVRSCTEGLRERAVDVLKVATHFDSRVASTISQVSCFETLQMQELPALLAAVDADVDVFQARQLEAARVSATLAAELTSVEEELGAVATSIQFHDITRQQLEHVVAALENLLSAASGEVISSSQATQARLQEAQLKNAAAAFAQATQTIDRDLEKVSARVETMAAAGNSIRGGDRKEKDCSGGAMQRRFAAIAHAVADLHSLERGTLAVVAELRGDSRDLDLAVNQVQSIELQLNHISINAVISARHLGAQGEALKVIAHAMGELRTESASRSRDAKAALDSIGDAIDSLAGGDALDANHDAGAILLGELNARMADLQSASESGAAAAANIAAMASNLCTNLQKAREHFRIGRIFAETVGRCSDSLDSVACQSGNSQASGMPSMEETREERYTMATEREVHRALTAGMTPQPFEEAAHVASGEYGDNVEFF